MHTDFYKLSLTKDEAERLISIMPNDIYKEFCRLHFLEKKNLFEVSEKLYYSRRHIGRISVCVKNYALKVLLKSPKPNIESLLVIKGSVDNMISCESAKK